MKKTLLLLPMILLLLASCKKEADEDAVRLVSMTVASVTGYQWGWQACLGPYDALIVRESGSGEWTTLGGIEGFTHEPGYECRLIVSEVTLANPPADGSSIVYRLQQIIGKTKKDSEGIPQSMTTRPPSPDHCD